MMKKSEKYLSEERRFARKLSGTITYDGETICRFFCTPGGCTRPDCTFKHVKLGCAFHFLAAQKCIYGTEGKFCPFSHDPSSIVVISALYPCSEDGCNRSCMHVNSMCIMCFNKRKRDRESLCYDHTNVRSRFIERASKIDEWAERRFSNANSRGTIKMEDPQKPQQAPPAPLESLSK